MLDIDDELLEQAMRRWHEVARELNDLRNARGAQVPSREARIEELEGELRDLEPVRAEHARRLFLQLDMRNR